MDFSEIARSRRINVSKILQKYDVYIKNSYWEKENYIKEAKNKIIKALLSDEPEKIEWLSIGRMAAKRQIEEIKNWINGFEDLGQINDWFSPRITRLTFEVTNQFEIYDDMKTESDSYQKKWNKSSSKKQIWITKGIVDKLNELQKIITDICNWTQWRPLRTEIQKQNDLASVKKDVIKTFISNEREKTRELFVCRTAVNKELDKMKEVINNCGDISQIRDYCNAKIEQLLKYSMHRESETTEFANIPSTLTGPQFTMNFPTEECTEIDWEILEELKKFVNISPKQERLTIDNKSFIWKSINIKIPNQENGENVTADWFVLSEVDVEPWNERKWKATDWQITRIEADKYRKFLPSPKNICNILWAIRYYIKNIDGTIIDDGIDYENDLRERWSKSVAWEYLKKLLSLKGIYFINGENGEKWKTLVCWDNNISFSTFRANTVITTDEIKHLAIFSIPKNKQ